MNLRKKLSKIQKDLNVPKNQRNTFGKYYYRSCEDILEIVKPLLEGLILTISDKIVNLGDRYYIKATVSLQDENETIETVAYAREALVKKGMDEAQITGAASSYARKYALNGLFAIDDEKDADTKDNKTEKAPEPTKAPMPTQPYAKPQYDNSFQKAKAGDKCNKCGAEMVENPKNGNIFCKDKCFAK